MSILPLSEQFFKYLLQFISICFIIPKKEVSEMGGNRNLKNRTAISTGIDNEIYKKLKEYSHKTSIPISRILDKAIELYLKTVDE